MQNNGDDYFNCEDDYFNCEDDVVTPTPPVVDLPVGSVPTPSPTDDVYIPPYQAPRKDNFIAELFYKIIAFFSRIFSFRW